MNTSRIALDVLAMAEELDRLGEKEAAGHPVMLSADASAALDRQLRRGNERWFEDFRPHSRIVALCFAIDVARDELERRAKAWRRPDRGSWTAA